MVTPIVVKYQIPNFIMCLFARGKVCRFAGNTSFNTLISITNENRQVIYCENVQNILYFCKKIAQFMKFEKNDLFYK